jgi:hypothetical protein
MKFLFESPVLTIEAPVLSDKQVWIACQELGL